MRRPPRQVKDASPPVAAAMRRMSAQSPTSGRSATVDRTRDLLIRAAALNVPCPPFEQMQLKKSAVKQGEAAHTYYQEMGGRV
jgi:hypothetical protein